SDVEVGGRERKAERVDVLVIVDSEREPKDERRNSERDERGAVTPSNIHDEPEKPSELSGQAWASRSQSRSRQREAQLPIRSRRRRRLGTYRADFALRRSDRGKPYRARSRRTPSRPRRA